jgi:serine/threonine protein kinase
MPKNPDFFDEEFGKLEYSGEYVKKNKKKFYNNSFCNSQQLNKNTNDIENENNTDNDDDNDKKEENIVINSFSTCTNECDITEDKKQHDKCKCDIIFEKFENLNNLYGFENLENMIQMIETYDNNNLKLLAIKIYNLLYQIKQINNSSKTSSQETPQDINMIFTPLKVKRTTSTWNIKQNKIVDNNNNYYQVINNYVLFEEIGSGSQGIVYTAFNNDDGKIYAIKKIKTRNSIMYKHKYNALMQEVSIMKYIDCVNIVKLYEVIEDKEDKIIYLVMNYISKGPILKCIDVVNKLYDTLNEEKIYKYTKQIITALHALHSKSVIHKDLKPENILIDENDVVYLADFGVSEIEKYHKSFLQVNTNGTVIYFAPELLIDSADVRGPPLDIWALGIVIFLMYFGYFPFYSDNINILKDKIIRHQPTYPPNISRDQIDFFNKIFCKDPFMRIKLSKIMKHSFFKTLEKNISSDEKLDKTSILSSSVLDNVKSPVKYIASPPCTRKNSTYIARYPCTRKNSTSFKKINDNEINEIKMSKIKKKSMSDIDIFNEEYDSHILTKINTFRKRKSTIYDSGTYNNDDDHFIPPTDLEHTSMSVGTPDNNDYHFIPPTDLEHTLMLVSGKRKNTIINIATPNNNDHFIPAINPEHVSI